MREAIANAGVFNLIIVFVIILLAFFIGSLSYSKAFKVKNKIIEEIEKDQGIEKNTIDNIENWMNEIGYRAIDGNFQCPEFESNKESRGRIIMGKKKYQYCIYEYDTCKGIKEDERTKCGKYYGAIAYMYFDVPIIGDMIRIPVRGETMTFNEINS